MINGLEQEKKDFFGMLKRHAFFKEKIILSSGKESEYYIDARRVTLTSNGAYLCARIMLDMIKDESYDAVGGPTLDTGSRPHPSSNPPTRPRKAAGQ